MSTDHEIEGAFRTLLEDDATMLPDRVLDALLAALPVTAQRRRWPIPSFSSLSHAGLVVTTVAIVIMVAAGVGWVARPGENGGPGAVVPSATPSPTPSPSLTPSLSPSPGYGSAPPGWRTPTPLVPATPLPDPGGSPIPTDLVGRQYNTAPLATQGGQALVLTLRSADDPHCTAMFDGRSTCFTILWMPNYPNHVDDKAVRGPARMEAGNVVLGFALVPNDPTCEGTSSTYAVSPDGWTLQGIEVPSCSFQGFTRH